MHDESARGACTAAASRPGYSSRPSEESSANAMDPDHQDGRSIEEELSINPEQKPAEAQDRQIDNATRLSPNSRQPSAMWSLLLLITIRDARDVGNITPIWWALASSSSVHAYQYLMQRARSLTFSSKADDDQCSPSRRGVCTPMPTSSR